MTSGSTETESAATQPGAILSNGSYRVLLTPSGHGTSDFGPMRLTAWTPDCGRGSGGLHLYLRDAAAEGAPGVRLGATGGGTGSMTRRGDGRVEWHGSPLGLEARIEFAVAPDHPLELRRLTLTNRSAVARRVEVTSFAEVVLNDPAAQASHPAFSRLFVQTEHVPDQAALLARRRPRSPEEHHPWLVHALGGAPITEYDTDRGRFLGRGGSLDRPRALEPGARLTGTVGNVLDPMVSLRAALELPAGGSKTLTFRLGAAVDRAGALLLARFGVDPAALDALFEAAARTHRERIGRSGLLPSDADRAEALALAVLTQTPGLRAASDILERAGGRLETLAAHGLSPGRPFVLVDDSRPAGSEAPAPWADILGYWSELGLPIDVVCLGAVAGARASATDQGRAPITLARAALAADALDYLQASAHAVCGAGWPARLPMPTLPASPAAVPSGRVAEDLPSGWRPAEELRQFNGCGGFTPDGREYVVRVRLTEGAPGRQLPPRPWTNVIANDTIGFIVSETGAGYTWSRNSREHRLTPWSNDQVLDTPGEAFYLRDEESGRYASLLPGPVADGGELEMVHGLGYSRCRRHVAGLDLETTLFVPESDPVRITRVVVANRRNTPARLSLYGWYRLVLGGVPEMAARFVATGHDAASGALLARSEFRGDYAGGVTFAAVAGRHDAAHVTADRAGFLGAAGTPDRPASLESGAPLDGRTGAGLDPAFAQQVRLTLQPGESREIAFLFGEADDADAIRALVAAYRDEGAVVRAEAAALAAWRHRVEGLQVQTPSPELDLMLNSWLPYQTLACRIQARSAHYQSGGAYGFRDQLQDAMSFVYLEPEVARRQILRHAAHQFVEGDVLHWWHTPRSRGLRTRFADDLLWLPWLTAFYVRSTGDQALLEEQAPYLTAPLLAPGEDEVFLLPADSGTSGPVYEHCLRAIDRSLGVGAHGLPLFGVGDWNDGMNRVGREGRGESVWMAFFLMKILAEFAPFCAARGDTARVERYARHHAELKAAVNAAGWDGAWYRRGYYDDGAPLGSKESDECRIDALAQAWAVMSGAADAPRREQALDAVEDQLISERDGIIRLLTPPFADSQHDPGYIKGYVAGVRENGGQYTHAALWVVRALAEAGRNNRAARLLAMLSPVHHTSTPERVGVYQVEPYVVAADVYGTPPHVGRGGWTWYTGSAAWMYRVGIESILGLTWIDGTTLRLEPAVPDDWPEFRIRWRIPPAPGAIGPATTYEIHATNPGHDGRGVARCRLDGQAHAVDNRATLIPLIRDGGHHRVELVLGGPGD